MNSILLRLFSAFLIISLLIGFTSCGDNSGDNSDLVTTDGAAADEVVTAAETESLIPNVDLGGESYTILNLHSYWGMYTTICPEELNGEVLNDAVYLRNQRLEQALNCKIIDTRTGTEGDYGNNIDSNNSIGKKSVLSGDDSYDVMYLSPTTVANEMAQGYFLNLYSLENFNLDAEYWDTAYNDSSKIGENLYCASGDAHLMGYDSSWCLFFNENMLEKYGLEMPYDLVRQGKWTIDSLFEYCNAVTNLNGDQSYKWEQNGNSVYGLSAHPNAPDKIIYASGERYIKTNEEGLPYFSAGSERFYDVCTKVANLFGTEGVTFNAHWDDFNASTGGYVYLFTTNRSAFLTAEIKAAQLMRDMDDTFGMLPLPKFDESQDEYQTTMMGNFCSMLIPVTNARSEDTALVMDTLAMLSHDEVIPVYYDSTVSQKGLRNEDSIEMLKIMRASRGVDMAVVYDWNADLASALRTKFAKGDADIASLIERHQKPIEAKMQKMIDLYLG
ncbi:MAG: extracellular solute-binding protein [Clostridiales bacterium]|nr:extracellular solute-binding protein [Clostridiales bacterium]